MVLRLGWACLGDMLNAIFGVPWLGVPWLGVPWLGAIAGCRRCVGCYGCYGWLPWLGARRLLCYLGSRLAKFVAYGDDIFLERDICKLYEQVFVVSDCAIHLDWWIRDVVPAWLVSWRWRKWMQMEVVNFHRYGGSKGVTRPFLTSGYGASRVYLQPLGKYWGLSMQRGEPLCWNFGTWLTCLRGHRQCAKTRPQVDTGGAKRNNQMELTFNQ